MMTHAQALMRVAILEKNQAEDLEVKMQLRERISELEQRCESTYCAYCGAFFEADRPDKTEAVSAHIRLCEKHPMRQVEKDRDMWEARARELETIAGDAGLL
jgi:hypothetical protein